MGDFIGHAFKLAVIYFVAYWFSVIVFGGAACMGACAVLKSAADWAREEEARDNLKAAVAPTTAPTTAAVKPTKPAPSSKVPAPKSSAGRR